MQAKLVNDTEIARAKRDYELNKAKYDTEVWAADNKIRTEKWIVLYINGILSAKN